MANTIRVNRIAGALGAEVAGVDLSRPLSGNASVPGDKSISHRAAIISSFGAGRSVIRNFSSARDCRQIRGAWENHVRYAITSTEWEARRSELTERFLTRSSV